METEKFDRCYCCDTLILKSRVECHHIFGKSSNETINVCVICHDLIDRVKFDDLDVFDEYLKCFEELKELPGRKIKYVKLFLLKSIKIMKYVKERYN